MGGPFVPLLLLLSTCSSVVIARHAPVRQTLYGPVRGFYHSQANDTTAEVYLRVPYARPPVGPLRFEYPERPQRWNKTLNTVESMPWCVQFWYPDPRIEQRHQSEDCLYLRIFVPVVTPSNHSRPYPVLLWLHGGSYQVNGANMFPVDGTVRNLVSRGLVVVFANYRLGPLGFLSTLNKHLPGNYGLEDQLMAVRWIIENIDRFDGDPNELTVGGESAGAASVSVLAASPKAKGLFKRAMLRSGSSLAPWAVRSTNTDLNSILTIRFVSCMRDDNDFSLIKKCLQKVPVEQIQSAWQMIGANDLLAIVSDGQHKPRNQNHPFLAHTYFTPVVDSLRGVDSLLPTYPEQLIAENAHLPVMIGVTSGECAAYVTWLYFLVRNDNLKVNLRDLNLVVPAVIYANSEQVKQAVSMHYTTPEKWASDRSLGKILVKIASDQNFVAPSAMEATLYRRANLTPHLYIFDHSNSYLDMKQNLFGVGDVGAAHGFDMVFLFQSTGVVDPQPRNIAWTPADLRVTAAVADSIANFVRYGKARPSANGAGDAHFVGRDAAPRTTYFAEELHFWQQTIPLVESLTLSRGFEFQPRMACLDVCGQCDYKLPFFILLFVVIFLVGLVTFVCCAQNFRRADSYSFAM